mmetsp:Transcript_86970/g.279091  ORF Transcript_86970/g.279091 Transcript_86970/m.279091 type:complete len:206 (-) Transcript_86970:345-962(-)
MYESRCHDLNPDEAEGPKREDPEHERKAFYNCHEKRLATRSSNPIVTSLRADDGECKNNVMFILEGVLTQLGPECGGQCPANHLIKCPEGSLKTATNSYHVGSLHEVSNVAVDKLPVALSQANASLDTELAPALLNLSFLACPPPKYNHNHVGHRSNEQDGVHHLIHGTEKSACEHCHAIAVVECDGAIENYRQDTGIILMWLMG